MIDVGVRQNHGIELLDGDRKHEVFLSDLGPLSLKHSAVERYRAAVDTQQMARPGYLTRRANEGHFHE